MDPNTPTQPGRNGGTLKRGENPKQVGWVSLTARMKRKLEEDRNADDLIDSTYDRAKAGDPVALKLIWERMEGSVPTKSEMTIDDVSNLTDAQRVARASKLFDAARTRRDGSPLDDGDGDEQSAV